MPGKPRSAGPRSLRDRRLHRPLGLDAEVRADAVGCSCPHSSGETVGKKALRGFTAGLAQKPENPLRDFDKWGFFRGKPSVSDRKH